MTQDLHKLVKPFLRKFARMIAQEIVKINNKKEVDAKVSKVENSNEFTLLDYLVIKKYVGEKTYEQCRNLETLDLYNLPIDEAIMNVVGKLTSLKQLTISSNNLKDISMLSTLVNLEYLSISNNEIEDISVLTNFPNLKELWMQNNKISNIDSLKELHNLETLIMHNNLVSDKLYLNCPDTYQNFIDIFSGLHKITCFSIYKCSETSYFERDYQEFLKSLYEMHDNSMKKKEMQKINTGLDKWEDILVSEVSSLKDLNIKHIKLPKLLGHKFSQEQVDELQKCLPNCAIDL